MEKEREEMAGSVRGQDEEVVIEKTDKNAAEWHPVLMYDFFPTICGWDNFLRKWREAESAKEKESLLHNGFDVNLAPKDDAVKRIFFYLEAAYGYGGLSIFFRLPDDRSGRYSDIPPQEMRQNVALKAWKVLCQKFFADSKDYKNSCLPARWHYFSSPDDCRLLDKILWFFREKDNLPCQSEPGHHDIIATDFIVKLVKLSLRGHGGKGNYLPHFVSRRHRFIDILWKLRKLDLLIEYWEHLTESDLNVLCDLALRGHPINKEAQYKSIDEAIIGYDRQAALVYVRLERMFKAKKKKEEIEKLERQAEKAQEKLERAKKLES